MERLRSTYSVCGSLNSYVSTLTIFGLVIPHLKGIICANIIINCVLESGRIRWNLKLCYMGSRRGQFLSYQSKNSPRPLLTKKLLIYTAAITD